jgi:hypothetical protein
VRVPNPSHKQNRSDRLMADYRHEWTIDLHLEVRLLFRFFNRWPAARSPQPAQVPSAAADLAQREWGTYNVSAQVSGKWQSVVFSSQGAKEKPAKAKGPMTNTIFDRPVGCLVRWHTHLKILSKHPRPCLRHSECARDDNALVHLSG